MIIAEYDANLSQWERVNFYNHLSNYTNTQYMYEREQTLSTNKQTLSDHAYSIAQAQNAVPRIFAFFLHAKPTKTRTHTSIY